MTKKIRITGGTHGQDTTVFLDEVEQKRLTDVQVILGVGEPNKVILEYHNVELDLLFDGIIISTPDVYKELHSELKELYVETCEGDMSKDFFATYQCVQRINKKLKEGKKDAL